VETINCLGSPMVADGSRGGREGGSSVILMLTEDREVVRQWHDGGIARWRGKLVGGELEWVRARERVWCVEVRWRPAEVGAFYRGTWGMSWDGAGGGDSNGRGLMAVRGRIKAGELRVRGGIFRCRSGVSGWLEVAQRGGAWWRHAVPSAEKMGGRLIGGAHMSAEEGGGMFLLRRFPKCKAAYALGASSVGWLGRGGAREASQGQGGIGLGQEKLAGLAGPVGPEMEE
jgi:hypothetical protein